MLGIIGGVVVVLLFVAWWPPPPLAANPDARRLYDDLLYKRRYNRLVRPVVNYSQTLTVQVGLKLSQLLNVDEKNEIIATNVWLLQEWHDSGLQWNPEQYGGVDALYVPSESIWLPDLVLYNNAEGDYTVTMMTKATLRHTGLVTWQPPAVYKSHCDIDVRYFPFDLQSCVLKFGSWTYDGLKVDLQHLWNNGGEFDVIPFAIDLDEYHRSVEWDLLEVSARKNSKRYPCCQEPYPDVSFRLVIRRKTLYYIINLLAPCVTINLLTVIVFCIPAECGEKISISISILLSLSLFQILLMEQVPGTSLVTPLMGKYLLFTCIIVVLSVLSSVLVLNVFHRSTPHPILLSTNKRRLFFRVLTKLLCSPLPGVYQPEAMTRDEDRRRGHGIGMEAGSTMRDQVHYGFPNADVTSGQSCCDCYAEWRRRRHLAKTTEAIEQLSYAVRHYRAIIDEKQSRFFWRCVSRLIDRLLLFVYLFVCVSGGLALLLTAPGLYDNSPPIPHQGP